MDPQFKGLDPFIPVNERVAGKSVGNYNYLCLLQLLQMTENLGKLQPAAVLPLIQLMMVKLHTSKNPKYGPAASLFAGMSWPNRKQLSGIQAVER